MHDLNQIAKANNDALVRAGVENFRAQGRHVLVRSEGLTVTSIETFATRAEADARHAEHLEGCAGPPVGLRLELLGPTQFPV